MLRQLIRCQHRGLTTARSYGPPKSLVNLIAAEDRYLFEGETLTDEENRAAIPKKPEPKTVTKIHHEMLAPQRIADILTVPSINDTFYATLAENSPLFGDESYQVVPVDKNENPTTVNLLFGNIVVDYMRAWRMHTRTLQTIPDDFLNPTLNQQSASELKAKITGDENFKIIIRSLLESTKAVANSHEVSSGRIDHSLLPGIITVDKVLIFLLQKFRPEGEEFGLLIETVRENISVFTQDSLRRVLESLIDLTPSQSEAAAILCDFLNAHILSAPYYSSLVRDLHPALLDKLACFFSAEGFDFKTSDEFLQMIIAQGFCPSEETILSYLKRYSRHLANTEYPLVRQEFNRTMAPLKSVIIAKPVSIHMASLLLRYSVDNATDLEQFLNLMHQEHNHEVLAAVASQVIEKVDQVVEQSAKSLTLSKVLKRFYTDKIVLDEKAKSLCSAIYDSLHSSNVKVFNE